MTPRSLFEGRPMTTAEVAAADYREMATRMRREASIARTTYADGDMSALFEWYAEVADRAAAAEVAGVPVVDEQDGGRNDR